MTNTINATANNTTVKFRNKFAKRIQNCPDALCKKLEEATISFVNESDNDKCHDLLWLMTHNPAKAVKTFGLELDVPAETANVEKADAEMANAEKTDVETANTEKADTETANAEKADTETANSEKTDAETANTEKKAEKPESLRISKELVDSWKDELRYQRSIKHKDFLKIEVSESCQEAFKALNNAAGAIIAATCYNACYERAQCSSKEVIERSLYLLSSEKEANFFGGIRSLHFGKSEAIALKSYASQIHDLLQAAWNEELARRSSDVNTPLAAQLSAWRKNHSTDNADEADTVDAVPNKPLDNVNEFVGNVPFAIPEEAPAIPKATVATEKAITAVNITADEAIFQKFLDACKALKDAGYDCNKVVGKMDAIAKILEASKDLNG